MEEDVTVVNPTIIATKFSPGDRAWFFKDNRAYDGIIVTIGVRVYIPEKTLISYQLSTYNKAAIKEEELFESKEALLASL